MIQKLNFSSINLGSRSEHNYIGYQLLDQLTKTQVPGVADSDRFTCCTGHSNSSLLLHAHAQQGVGVE